jgi:hypothetical protein
MDSESLVALRNNRISEESLGIIKTESIGRGFEPRPPHEASVLRRVMADISSPVDGRQCFG